MKGGVNMDYNVHVFINGKEVNSADLPNYVITNRYIDMIINDINFRQGREVENNEAS